MHVPLLLHVHVHVYVILEGDGGQFGQLGSIGHCVCTQYSHCGQVITIEPHAQ